MANQQEKNTRILKLLKELKKVMDADNRRHIEMKTLKDVKVGMTAKVVKLHGEGPVKRRIMDMGITKGIEIFVRKTAPLGDPIELSVRGYELSLRKADAEMIEVE